MALTNKQVIDSLISFYKSKGEDMTYLLEDPIFTGLPIHDKVEAIKEHAGTIRNSSPATLNSVEKADVKANVLGSSLVGLGTGVFGALAGAKLVESIGLPIAIKMKANRLGAITAVAGAGLVTGVISGAMGYSRAKHTASARQAVREQLLTVQTNPTDINSIGVLAAKSQHNRDHSFRNAIMNRIQGVEVTKALDKDWASHLYLGAFHQYADPHTT